jgi:hypothetical protein
VWDISEGLPPSEKIASELNSGAQARKTRIRDKQNIIDSGEKNT